MNSRRMLDMLETHVRQLENKSKQKREDAYSLSSSSTMPASEDEIASQLLDSDLDYITDPEEDAAGPSAGGKTNDNHNWKGKNQYKNRRRCLLLLLEIHLLQFVTS